MLTSNRQSGIGSIQRIQGSKEHFKIGNKIEILKKIFHRASFQKNLNSENHTYQLCASYALPFTLHSLLLHAARRYPYLQ